MPDASLAIGSFLGGEISAFAQGRFDKPDYRISLRVCLNSFPAEIGPWVRRPGTMHAGTTLNGLPGRVMRFDFNQSAAVTCEYTDGKLRFRSGPTLISGTLTTPYIGGAWASIRAVQAETTQILLTPAAAPQALTVTTLPAPGVNTAFAINPAVFNDGPYLDPFTNGVQATPGAKTGIVTLTLAFPAYDSTKAYKAGDFVTASSVNYISLLDQNVANAPASLGAWWATTSASAAINGGKGFLGTDIGRLVRLLSEPAAWVAGTTYGSGAVVSYNATGLPGAASYWQSAAGSNTGNIPGADLTHWTLVPSGAAIWSWGKITSLSNIIDRALSGSAAIGDMTSSGGNAAAFDGVFVQNYASGALKTSSGGIAIGPAALTLTSYVGKNYSGASNQKIQQATLYPSSDYGFVAYGYTGSRAPVLATTFNLRAKASAPASSSDGTLLGTSGPMGNSFSAVTVVSSDQSTAWAYVWVEQVTTLTLGEAIYSSWNLNNAVAELSFFNPPGTGISSGVNVEILGPALLYTQPIMTWRLGVYSNTTGWPTCGVYNDGRLYLGGAVGNRFDACYANGAVDGTVNFAPTDQYGAVTAAHAISYTFKSNGVNPILWMKPDLQGIKAGTKAGEWLIQAPTAGPISPLNISARNVTHHGSANVEPVDTEHTLIFVQRHGRKLLEYFPDVFSGKFSAPNLADKSIRTKPGVTELAYTSAVTPIIWGRCTDGSWFGITYKRDSLASAQPPTFYAWHGHALGSGRVVESICSGPSVGGDLDALTMVTNDPNTGIRHVEIMTDMQDELTDLPDSWYLDDAVQPTLTLGATSATLSGLPYPDGAVVQVFAAGIDCGDPGEGKAPSDFTVASGAITVPFGDGISAGSGRGLFTGLLAETASATGQLVVGFTYNSDGQIVRPMSPADSGARNGPAFGKVMRSQRYALKLVNTLGLTLGKDFNSLKPVNMKPNPSVPLAALTTFSGVAFDGLNDDYDYDNAPVWRAARPFPANIIVIGFNTQTQDQS